jgi:hypothetical protein
MTERKYACGGYIEGVMPLSRDRSGRLGISHSEPPPAPIRLRSGSDPAPVGTACLTVTIADHDAGAAVATRARIVEQLARITKREPPQ